MRARATSADPAPRPPPAAVRALLEWFGASARPLPWRRTRDPYAIWISEVMLQQTQAATVIPYWERWVRELPGLGALAAAPERQLLKLWEGLGYYRRVRHLQQAAQILVARHGGQFPRTVPDWLALPGVGRYTAGAVLSIAFNQPAPILDGNLIRVLCRLYGIAQPPRAPAVQRRLWQLAEAWVRAAAALEQRQPRLAPACTSLNQALMELGAVICTPRQPGCERCPLRRHCVARATGQTATLPLRERRPAAEVRAECAVVLVHAGRVLVRQRPAEGVNGGLWEFPNFEWHGDATPSGGKSRAGRPTPARIRQRLGLAVRHLRAWKTVRHSITRYRIELRAWRATAGGPPRSHTGARWVTLLELQQLPMTAAHRRLAQMLVQEETLKQSRRSPRDP